MPKRKELSVETRALIIAHHHGGKSNRQIAKQLKLGNTTVDYIVKKYRESGSFLNKSRSGRSRVTTSAEDRTIVITSKRNRRKTAPEIAAEINGGCRKFHCYDILPLDKKNTMEKKIKLETKNKNLREKEDCEKVLGKSDIDALQRNVFVDENRNAKWKLMQY
ncbi:winged helix-turn helix [Holotrichia oblita]|uniref:Winged helix-turn helix n=1 Tax=Holotrichia oblita TaxID=644536 RepID=A0ACB9T5N1_HOLOL|nr:winged helix-turn helix [Holotrichia oblita]